MKKNVIEVKNLSKYFEFSSGIFQKKNIVKAVDDVSFFIPQGESLGLVVQSGCGKTTTARTLTLLEEKTSGSVNVYNSKTNLLESIDNLDEDQLKNFRRNIQMIFQDPYEAMNPRWTIKETLKTVGITPPENYLNRYPHELSGGQRQRVAIARALIMEPKFVICDEPTSMLDVSIRISIMDLMLELARDLGVSYLYITHDLAVARYMCNRIAVMFNGKIVEIAKTEDLLSNPIHPYTKRLISSIPVPDPKYTREKYEINFDELDEIISNNTENLPMVDVGNEHFVATHDVKDLLI